MYHYEERQSLPEFLRRVWHKHWIMIIVAAFDFVVILYSIIGIMKVGFREAAGLFGIGIFVWFCLSWIVVREFCGLEIHNWLIKPLIDCVDNHWKYLKWYVKLLNPNPAHSHDIAISCGFTKTMMINKPAMSCVR